MAYVNPNYRTKKELKAALALGGTVEVVNNSAFADAVPTNGTVYLEGPHYPAPHTWYAVGTMRAGRLVSVK